VTGGTGVEEAGAVASLGELYQRGDHCHCLGNRDDGDLDPEMKQWIQETRPHLTDGDTEKPRA
jgi:hypothetical protein